MRARRRQQSNDDQYRELHLLLKKKKNLYVALSVGEKEVGRKAGTIKTGAMNGARRQT